MASLWVDRLAEVWASPGTAGTGVVMGADVILTARHVVAGALTTGEGRLLSRVVRPGRSVSPWAPVRAVWDDLEWDLALLRVDSASDDARLWEAPASSAGAVVAELGLRAASGCEAVGFPASSVQHASAEDPGDVVRQTEHVVGTVLPAGQGKPPVNPERT
jgi:S1-C subfamily serine protease